MPDLTHPGFRWMMSLGPPEGSEWPSDVPAIPYEVQVTSNATVSVLPCVVYMRGGCPVLS